MHSMHFDQRQLHSFPSLLPDMPPLPLPPLTHALSTSCPFLFYSQLSPICAIHTLRSAGHDLVDLSSQL